MGNVIKRERERVAELVREAGGRIVGQLRLQNIAYLLELTGQGAGFDFEHRHSGPYSEALADAVWVACAFGLVTEEEHVAPWGGRYSSYTATAQVPNGSGSARSTFASVAASIGSLELVLVTTAAYLAAVEHAPDPWQETMRRKPAEAAEGRLEKAKDAYRTLLEIPTPKPLPQLA